MSQPHLLPGPTADLWDWQLQGACRGGPFVHGLIGAAAATLVIAGAGGAMLHAGTFDKGDKTGN